MRTILLAAYLALAGCATAQKNVWLRTDGRPMRGDAALEQQYAIDAEVCKGEAQKANLSAGTNYYRGLVANIAEDMRRSQLTADVAKGCMVERGYLNVPEQEAEQRSHELAATQKERQRAAALAPRRN